MHSNVKLKLKRMRFEKNIYVLVLPIENKDCNQFYFIFAIRL